jgi:F1F0 ATPase subunit 2
MRMSDLPALVLALLAGAMLGAFFFGGLWWTVQRGTASDRPALWFLVSLLLRTGVVLGGFYAVAQGHWSSLAASLLGFLIARVIVVKWLTGEMGEDLTLAPKESSDAPQPR